MAPRPNLLALLAQPELAIIQGTAGTGPFRATRSQKEPGAILLTRNISETDDEAATKEEVLLSGAPVARAIQSFLGGKIDLVLGGTLEDLPIAQRAKLPRGSLQFDPASGLFGLVPLRKDNHLDDPDVRRMFAQAIDRDAFVGSLGVPGLAGRATLLEQGLDQLPPPVAPAWTGTPLAERLPALQSVADRKFGKSPKPTIRVLLPTGPGADLVLAALARSWSPLGFTVERAADRSSADFALVDEVAPSSSAAWFVRQFRCGVVTVCDADTDTLIDAARDTQVPQQRNALLQQAAARIDDAQLFLPITAPVRWSLVGRQVQGFAGNRFAIHTLTDLQQKPGSGN